MAKTVSKPQARQRILDLAAAANIQIPNGTVDFQPVRHSVSANGRVIFPASIIIPSSAEIFDPSNPENRIAIDYIERETPITSEDGETVYRLQKGSIMIEHGRLSVDCKRDKVKYAYLMLLDCNESKEGRDPKVEPLFKLSTDDRAIMREIDDQKIVNFAEQQALAIEDPLEVETMLKSLGLPYVGMTYPSMRKALAQYAKSNPQAFISKLDDEGAKLYTAIHYGMKSNYVSLSGAEGKWKINGKEVLDLKASVKKTDEAIDRLIEHLQSKEGEKHKQALLSKVVPV